MYVLSDFQKTFKDFRASTEILAPPQYLALFLECSTDFSP
jgi:hypothetical protein